MDKENLLDFDDALLPEDIWEGDHEVGDFKVNIIMDVRYGQENRYEWMHRQVLIKWNGYPDPSRVDEGYFSCRSLLQEIEQERLIQNHFVVMQSQ